MTHTVHMSTDTLTPLDNATGGELIDWAMRVRYSGPQPKTIKCTVEQLETIAAMNTGPAPKVTFGMDCSVLGLPVEWVTDPAESTFFAGRVLAALDPPPPIRKLTAYATVPNELLNPTPPSEEDVARWRAEDVARRTREDTRHAELLAAGGVVAAVAGLHSPDDSRCCRECESGDFMTLWPCNTWELLDEQVPR